MLIDTHCHLDAPEFDEDRDAVITAARQAGLGAIVVPAVFRRNWDTVQALAEREPDVWFALGLHPLYVNEAGPDDLEHLRQRVMAVRDHPRFVGIGEIGLDYFVPGLDPARQQAVFEAQVRLAAEFGLPVILHTRRSVDAVTKQLRRFRPPSGIAHAFNGSCDESNGAFWCLTDTDGGNQPTGGIMAGSGGQETSSHPSGLSSRLFAFLSICLQIDV